MRNTIDGIDEVDILLTTKDNKFNPFTEYDDWKYFDEKQMHYNTEAYVARDIGMLDPDISEQELAHERVKSFKEIIKLNDELGYDIYVMISRGGKRLNDTPSVYLGQKDIEGTPGEGPAESPTP